MLFIKENYKCDKLYAIVRVIEGKGIVKIKVGWLMGGRIKNNVL